MNNVVFIHSKYNEKSRILKIIYMLIPFMIYGFYKNGLKLYNLSGNYLIVFKPIILLIIAILISLIFAKIFKEKIFSYRLLTNLIISLVTFANTNILFYIVLISLINILIKYVKINGICLYMVIYSLLLLIFHKYTYLNLFESTYETNYSFLDLLLGKGIGGISNTMLLFTFIAFIIFLFSYDYKKEIPIVSLAIYYLVMLIIGFVNNNLDPNILLNNNLLFAIIFVSPLSAYSPYTRGGNIIYGLLLSIILIIFSFIDLNFGVYLSILILAFLSKYFDKIITH